MHIIKILKQLCLPFIYTETEITEVIHSLGEDGDWHEGEPQLAHSPTHRGPPGKTLMGVCISYLLTLLSHTTLES